MTQPTTVAAFECLPVSGWEQFAEEVRAPSNYKDPVKIQEYVEKARAKQALEASRRFLTGKLTKVMVRTGVPDDCSGQEAFHTWDAATAKEPALVFLEKILPDRAGTLFVLEASTFRQLLIADYLERGWDQRCFSWIFDRDYKSSILRDPLDYLGWHPADSDYAPLIRRFNLKVEGEGIARSLSLGIAVHRLVESLQ